MHSGYEGASARSNKCGGVWSDHTRAKRAVSARIEVPMRHTFHEKFTYTMAFRSMLCWVPVMVRRMRAFVVEYEMGRGGGCRPREFVSGLVALCAILTWNTDEHGGAFPVVQSLAKILVVICATLKSL